MSNSPLARAISAEVRAERSRDALAFARARMEEQHDYCDDAAHKRSLRAMIDSNQRLVVMQKALLESLIGLVASAIDAKSPYTGGHCQRVPELTKMLATRRGPERVLDVMLRTGPYGPSAACARTALGRRPGVLCDGRTEACRAGAV